MLAKSTKAMQLLMDILLELEKYPLKLTGSLVPADVRDKVGGFAQAPLFETPGKSLGPFSKLESAYKAMIRTNKRYWQQSDHESTCR